MLIIYAWSCLVESKLLFKSKLSEVHHGITLISMQNSDVCPCLTDGGCTSDIIAKFDRWWQFVKRPIDADYSARLINLSTSTTTLRKKELMVLRVLCYDFHLAYANPYFINKGLNIPPNFNLKCLWAHQVLSRSAFSLLTLINIMGDLWTRWWGSFLLTVYVG